MSEKRLAVFRVDASWKTGGGHAVRSLVLADQLVTMGWRCRFVVDEEAIDVVPRLKNGEHELVIIQKSFSLSDMEKEAKWIGEVDESVISSLIVDSYRHDASFETYCRRWTNHIVAIDGTMRNHDIDLLVDVVPGRDVNAHDGLVPAGCSILSGPDFVLLSPNFHEYRAASLKRRQDGDFSVEKILVAFGASDTGNLVELALGEIGRINLDVEVNIILGNRNKERETVDALIEKHGLNARVHGWVTDMAGEMAQADLFVSTAGGSVWEACALGLPTVALSVADNQRIIAKSVAGAGAMVDLGWADANSKMLLQNALSDILTDRNKRAELSKQGASLCDGKGVNRVAEAIAHV